MLEYGMKRDKREKGRKRRKEKKPYLAGCFPHHEESEVSLLGQD